GSESSATVHEVAIEDVAQFVVGSFGDLAVLSVETRQSGPLAVCTGYPQDWLKAMAAVLARHCRLPIRTVADLMPSPAALLRAIAGPAEQRAAAVHQFGEALRSRYEEILAARDRVPVPQFKENPDQPPTSRVIHQVHDNGVTLIVPPGKPGLFFLLGCGL